MISKEDQKKIFEGDITEVYHKIYGKGEVVMSRVDKLNNNRIKAEILFTIQDLLEDITRPEFLFIDDEILSVTPWE